jgi:hypothetical protein
VGDDRRGIVENLFVHALSGRWPFGWGKPVLRFKSAIFRQFFSLNFFLESAIFRHFRQQQSAIFAAFRSAKKVPFFAIFRQQQSAIFRRFSLSEEKCHFSRKISRKTGSIQLTAQNWTIFRRISHREKYNFSPFSPHFAPRKKVPFSRKKSRKTGSTQPFGLSIETRRQTELVEAS